MDMPPRDSHKTDWLGFHTTKKYQNVGLLEKPHPVGLFSYGVRAE